MTMNVKEGYLDSDINNDIGKFNSIQSAASCETKSLALKNMKINWATRTILDQLLAKYGNDTTDSNKKVVYDHTVSQAIEKLNYRKNNNNNN
jgi:predicted DNA-binding ArsR family transcriptional regulator